jgi:selenocysteine lyase/cysteine desulfurase
LIQRLIDGLGRVAGVTVHGTRDARRQVAPVSFTLHGISPSDAALRLDEEYGVLCRVGLHCAPAAHRTIGTFPTGTIRFAPGSFTTEAEIDAAVAAVAALKRGTGP